LPAIPPFISNKYLLGAWFHFIMELSENAICGC
jgi:hypothetical protein